MCADSLDLYQGRYALLPAYYFIQVAKGYRIMNTENTVRVWDVSVRIFHWSLVISFAVAYVTGEESDLIHAYAGYVVLALLCYRIVWGIVGSRYARFSSFLFGPATTISYIKNLLGGKAKRYLGHNPAGSAMVFVLLISLSITVWTGLELYATEGKGPLADNAIIVIGTAHADGHENRGNGGEEFWEEFHEVASNFTLVMVFIHILGVLFSSKLHKENLVKAMITGRKRAP